MKYIDISTFQKTVDFQRVQGNVDGVIIRAGYGAGNVDAQFQRNASECNRTGIPCGAYWFSYALNPAMAKAEAEKFLAAVKPYKMELPLAFDFERDSIDYMKRNGVTPTKALCTSIAHAFCQTVEAAGYYVMLYANRDFLTNWFDSSVSRYDIWYAAWPSVVDVTKPPRKCGIWQWGGSSVPGITGDVDSNEAYNDYAKIIRNAKKPVMTIKPFAAGRTTPFIGLTFNWNAIRPCDMITVGASTELEAREDIEYSFAALEHRAPNVEGRGSPVNQEVLGHM